MICLASFGQNQGENLNTTTNDTCEHLVFFETSGNQAYIYATNKLRENIGASELTYRAGTQWVLEAAGFAGVPTDKPAEFRKWLKPGQVRDGIEIILATSGKSLLVVRDDEDKTRAREIIRSVTERAAREAPGLSITGAIVELASRGQEAVSSAMREAHERFNANRDLMPTPAQRFSMLPFCEPCATSGLPSAGSRDNTFYAAPALAQREMADQWFERIRRVFKYQRDGLFIAASADQMEKEFEALSWLGVVFSDGNGLGQIMMKFKEWLNGEDYLTTLRDFSVELDAATETAFYRASQHLEAMGAAQALKKQGRKRLPLVPLLLGGDDLTVLVDGRYALPFTRQFLAAFEEETAKSPTIARIARRALGAGRLSAGAGVAIVKSHFPFHSAHALAESLLKSAKQAKREVLQKMPKDGINAAFPCSSLDFHILFDAAYSGLDDIRQERRTGRNGERLWAGPYVVTPVPELTEARSTDWASRHHLDELMRRVKAFNATDEDGHLRLPSSQMHSLREALAQGRTVADARLAETRWLDDRGLTDLLEEKDSLFHVDGDKTVTRFLDALGSAEFWPAVETQEPTA